MSMMEKSLSNIPNNKVIGVDIYNFSTTGDTGRTLSTAGGGLNEHIPCVLIAKEVKSERSIGVERSGR